jgi:hypothetical protein
MRWWRFSRRQIHSVVWNLAASPAVRWHFGRPDHLAAALDLYVNTSTGNDTTMGRPSATWSAVPFMARSRRCSARRMARNTPQRLQHHRSRRQWHLHGQGQD